MMAFDIDLIARKLGKAKRVGNGWSCLCPAHDDHNPSFSLSLRENGTLLVHCYAGCSFLDIMFALRRRNLLENGGSFRGIKTTSVPHLNHLKRQMIGFCGYGVKPGPHFFILVVVIPAR
ncbi:MAG: hypothetical protein BGO67_08435 [Alphaproteobacteria bacterium 41-28]|nr:MAG: hypothetical protein BGO67_08435 [Alphaproteobacteria bacterium 41-28]